MKRTEITVSGEHKLTGKELFFFFMTVIPPLLLLFLPTYGSIYIGHDSWIVFTLLAVIDTLFTLLLIKIYLKSDGKDLIDLCRSSFGRIAGTLFAIAFAIVFAYKSGVFFRDSLEFVFMSTYSLEPIYYFAIPMLALIVFGQFQKKENVIRLCNIIFLIMLVTYFFLMISAVRNVDFSRLSPVMSESFSGIAGALPHFFTFSGNSLIMLAFIEKIKKSSGVGKYVMSGVAVAYLTVIVLSVLFVAVFGDIAGFMTSSVLELSLFLNSEIYFSNLESLIKVIWAFGIFVRDCIYMTATVGIFSKLFNRIDKRSLNIIIPLLICIPTVVLFRNEETFFYYSMGTTSIICGIMQYLLPTLLFVGIILNKRRESCR